MAESVQNSAQAGGGAFGRYLGQCITRVQLQQVAHGLEASDETAGGVALRKGLHGRILRRGARQGFT